MHNNNLLKTQPHFSYFDQSFSDNPHDVLFCSLNEVEPIFNGKDLPSNEFTAVKLIDPRTTVPVTQSFYDYTIQPIPEIFKSPKSSSLSRAQHCMCLEFLKSIKAKKHVSQQHFECFKKTTKLRTNEQQEFLKFIKMYSDSNFENIFAANKVLVELYRKIYKLKTQTMMKKHVDGHFQIHTGFPVLRQCGNSETFGEICDIKLVHGSCKNIEIPSLIDLSKMKPKIEKYLDLNSLEVPTSSACVFKEERVQLEISIEAFVFILCAGEYIDTPTELIADVIASDDGECFIRLTELLPSRNTGAHTSEFLVNKCMKTFLENNQNLPAQEIRAVGFQGDYFLQNIDDTKSQEIKKSINTTPLTLVKWNLVYGSEKKLIPIVTQTEGANIQNRKQIFNSLKLEYKPEFGCEIISKASLLREWLNLRLSNSKESELNRLRVNANTFQTVLQESLTVEDVENELKTHYKVNISRLIGSLGEFLNLFSNISQGRYLLKFNPRFTDKLMLYAETKDPVSKSCVSLHGLLNEEPSDLAFMSARQFTPIDHTLCSPMHEFHKILPCHFSPGPISKLKKIIDDRSFILKKVKEKENKKLAAQKMLKMRRKKSKLLKRTQKRKLKRQKQNEDNQEVQELEEEIQNDRILYGLEDVKE